MYAEVYKYHRDNVQKVIFAGATVVLGFAATLVGFALKGTPIIRGTPGEWGINEWTVAILFMLFFLITWSSYFVIIMKMEYMRDEALRRLKRKNEIGDEEYSFVTSSHSRFPKYVPFIFSAFLLFLVYLDIEIT